MAGRRNSNRKCMKSRTRMSDNRASGQWAELPSDILVLILTQLSMLDYLSFGSVCRTWRSVAVTHKANIILAKPPLIVSISSYAKRACSFLNIFDQSSYKAMLRDLTRKICLGFTSGYLIMLEIDLKICLVNPITRKELHFPKLPLLLRSIVVSYFRAILVSPRISDFQLVVLYRPNHSLFFSRPGDANWVSYENMDLPLEFADLTFFKGRIYVLASNSLIGELRLSPYPYFKQLPVKSIPSFFQSSSLQLVASNEKLFMADYSHERGIIVCELDLTRMEWVRTENLGDNSLFLSDMNGSAVVNPTNWGGRSNCLYILPAVFSRCYVCFLNERRFESVRFLEADGLVLPVQSHIWYFPHLGYSRYLLHES